MEEQEKLNGVCFWLIKQCMDTGAETMTVTQTKVTQFGKELGNWEITVKKVSN